MTRDSFIKLCEQAEGYIELGLYDEASNVLETLPSQLKITQEAIQLQMTILVKTGHFLKASYLAESLSMGDPENTDRMHLVAQLRYDAGEPREALDWLNQIEPKRTHLVHYNHLKAKCFAALQDLEQCRHSLAEAHSIDPDLRWMSLEDLAFDLIFGKDPTI